MNHKVLVINDINESINYSHSDADNAYEYKPSLEILYDIFKKDHDSIFSCNTINCISLILFDGAEIQMNDYKFDKIPVFIKIYNDILKETGNEIIIALNHNHYISKKPIKWSQPHSKTQEELKEYPKLPTESAPVKVKYKFMLDIVNGFDFFKETLSNAYIDDSSICAINQCTKTKITLSNKITYHAYLPATGQMKILFDYGEMINYIIKHLRFDEIPLNDKIAYWTSIEYDGTCAWTYYKGGLAIDFKDDEINSTKMLPLFTDKSYEQ